MAKLLFAISGFSIVLTRDPGRRISRIPLRRFEANADVDGRVGLAVAAQTNGRTDTHVIDVRFYWRPIWAT